MESEVVLTSEVVGQTMFLSLMAQCAQLHSEYRTAQVSYEQVATKRRRLTNHSDDEHAIAVGIQKLRDSLDGLSQIQVSSANLLSILFRLNQTSFVRIKAALAGSTFGTIDCR